MAVDYEALALEMGGKIVPDIDYDALALEMGGTVIPVVAPKLGSMEPLKRYQVLSNRIQNHNPGRLWANTPLAQQKRLEQWPLEQQLDFLVALAVPLRD
jgi:hypothetical protein